MAKTLPTLTRPGRGHDRPPPSPPRLTPHAMRAARVMCVMVIAFWVVVMSLVWIPPNHMGAPAQWVVTVMFSLIAGLGLLVLHRFPPNATNRQTPPEHAPHASQQRLDAVTRPVPSWDAHVSLTFAALIVVFLALVLSGALSSVLNTWQRSRLSPLHRAACDGDVTECERLVKGGLAVDAADDRGVTALSWAVFYCNVDVVRKLIELGADVNHVDNRGRFTPLMYSATTLRGHDLRGTQEQRNEIARLLIQHGADVNHAMGDPQTSGSGQTTLHFAAKDKNAGLVRILLAAGANPNAKESHGWTPLDIARFPDYAPNDEVIRTFEGR